MPKSISRSYVYTTSCSPHGYARDQYDILASVCEAKHASRDQPLAINHILPYSYQPVTSCVKTKTVDRK